MSPSHAVKRGKRYRYYTSQAVVQLRPETGGSITRLPADDIERVVIQDLLHALTDRITEHTLLGPDAPIAQRLALTERATALAGTLPDDRATLRALIKKVTAGQNGVRVDIATAALANVLGVDLPGADAPHTIKRSIGVRLRRCRGEAKLITGHDHETDTSPPRTSLLKALARAHDWNQRLIRGEAPFDTTTRRRGRCDGRLCQTPATVSPASPQISWKPSSMARHHRHSHSIR